MPKARGRRSPAPLRCGDGQCQSIGGPFPPLRRLESGLCTRAERGTTSQRSERRGKQWKEKTDMHGPMPHRRALPCTSTSAEVGGMSPGICTPARARASLSHSRPPRHAKVRTKGFGDAVVHGATLGSCHPQQQSYTREHVALPRQTARTRARRQVRSTLIAPPNTADLHLG
jgi:hypothetical protein